MNKELFPYERLLRVRTRVPSERFEAALARIPTERGSLHFGWEGLKPLALAASLVLSALLALEQRRLEIDGAADFSPRFATIEDDWIELLTFAEPFTDAIILTEADLLFPIEYYAYNPGAPVE